MSRTERKEPTDARRRNAAIYRIEREMEWAAPSGNVPALERALVAQQRRVAKWRSKR